jgi:hypothetical protein
MSKKHIPYIVDTHIYSVNDAESVVKSMLETLSTVGNGKSERFYNIPCSFDIETSSFYRDEKGSTYNYEQVKRINQSQRKLEKCSCMYVWQFGINGKVFMGRTWNEFLHLVELLSTYLQLSKNQRLICYVHNLSYEFQFIRKLFDWTRVFSIDLRKPIYAITKGGLEFRCSYLLSGYSLAKLADQLNKYKCAKMVGDLDYSLVRHSKTELTQKEVQYCTHDVIVVMNYIQERIEELGNILRLPLTKTGFVRKFCRKNCLYTRKEGKQRPNYSYRKLMESLTISGIDEFNMLQRAFAGGFTHANAEYANETVHEVDSYDFTSSYPYVMVSEKFPVSKGVAVECRSMKHFDFLVSKYCCVFDVEFNDIFSSRTQDMPISVSKCFVKEKAVENNGRLVCAKRIVLTITNVDYISIKNFYSWGSMRIGKMYCYRKSYLPKEFISAILDLYEKKTTLKGVEGKETEYLNSKEMLNSCYGMCVTNPLRDEFIYGNEWDIRQLSESEKINMLHTYNTSLNRFLSYPWGVFVTAFARRNLFTAIAELGEDYIYSDTDSVKLKNGDRHKEYFKLYNNIVENKLRAACKYHGIDISKCMPETIKGITKILGVWDYEGRYKRFKTLGAKRYMSEDKDGNVSLTVSGVNKKCAVPYLLKEYGKDGIFDAFTNYLSIPPEATGKNIHTYIDYEQNGTVLDYKGESYTFDELCGVHLEPTGYSLSLSVMYLNYLLGIKLKE